MRACAFTASARHERGRGRKCGGAQARGGSTFAPSALAAPSQWQVQKPCARASPGATGLAGFENLLAVFSKAGGGYHRPLLLWLHAFGRAWVCTFLPVFGWWSPSVILCHQPLFDMTNVNFLLSRHVRIRRLFVYKAKSAVGVDAKGTAVQVSWLYVVGAVVILLAGVCWAVLVRKKR